MFKDKITIDTLYFKLGSGHPMRRFMSPYNYLTAMPEIDLEIRGTYCLMREMKGASKLHI